MKSFKSYNTINFQEYLSEKDHRKTMIKAIKLPKDIAEDLHAWDSKYSITWANMLVNQYKKDTKQKSFTEPDMTNYYKKNRSKLTVNVRNIVDWVKGRNNNPNPKESNINLKALTFDDALKHSKNWHDYLKKFSYKVSVNPETVKEQAGALINYPDGWYWYDLKTRNCAKESDMMGHCGRTEADTLITLRDVHGLPHLTMAYNYKPSGYTQLKGKGNKKPDKKYHDKILDIFNKLKISEYKSEYAGADDFKVNDLPDNKKNELIKKYPGLQDPFDSIENILSGKEKNKTLEDYKDMFSGHERIKGNDIFVDVESHWFNGDDSNIVEKYALTYDYVDMDWNVFEYNKDYEVYATILENMNPKLKKMIADKYKGIFEEPAYKDFELMNEKYGDLDDLIYSYNRAEESVLTDEFQSRVQKEFESALEELGHSYDPEKKTIILNTDIISTALEYVRDQGYDYIDFAEEEIIDSNLRLGTDYERWQPYADVDTVIDYMVEYGEID